jgi:homoserine kinase type II
MGHTRREVELIMKTMGERYVYLLWHIHDLGDGETSEKLLGVYSTEERANARIAVATTLPGFREASTGFEVARYKIDFDEWGEGYITS